MARTRSWPARAWFKNVCRVAEGESEVVKEGSRILLDTAAERTSI